MKKRRFRSKKIKNLNQILVYTKRWNILLCLLEATVKVLTILKTNRAKAFISWGLLQSDRCLPSFTSAKLNASELRRTTKSLIPSK